jgi:hypothetical protein
MECIEPIVEEQKQLVGLPEASQQVKNKDRIAIYHRFKRD